LKAMRGRDAERGFPLSLEEGFEKSYAPPWKLLHNLALKCRFLVHFESHLNVAVTSKGVVLTLTNRN